MDHTGPSGNSGPIHWWRKAGAAASKAHFVALRSCCGF
nr:MAG TPA: hypothetical protein [Caudoviricetes sp.]